MSLQALLDAAIDAGWSSRWCPHTPFAKQRQFLDLNCTEALYGGAAGPGKSDALLMAALQYIDVPGYSAMLFRRTFTDLALPGAIMDRAQEWLAGTAARWRDRDKQFTFPSGAKLTFGYLEGPRDHLRYQSAQFQFIGFDEQSQFEERQVLYLASRLRRSSGSFIPLRLRGATNPGGVGHRWIKKRYRIPDKPGDDVIWSKDQKGNAIAFVPARLTDNPFVDREAYLEMLGKLDSVTRDQLERGFWIQDAGLLVYKFDAQRNVIPKLPELPDGEQWTCILSSDFGVTKPTALVALFFSEHDPCAYAVEAEEWVGLAPSTAGDIFRQWQKRYNAEKTMGDIGGLGKGFEAEFTKRHVPIHAAEKADKLGNIKLLNGDLEHGLVKILEPKCGPLIDTISTLQWADDTNQKEHPGMPNHTTDALLYGWRECRNWLWEPRPEEPGDPVEAEAEEWRQKLREDQSRYEADAREEAWREFD